MPASKAQRVKTAERRDRAVQMRLAGADWAAIARALGYASRGAACTDVERALEQATAAMARNTDVLRHTELARLDRLQAAFWARAIGGGDDAMEAARTVLGIIDRRCKLLGLNAPERHEVYTLGGIEAQIQRLQAEMDDSAPVPAEPGRADFDVQM